MDYLENVARHIASPPLVAVAVGAASILAISAIAAPESNYIKAPEPRSDSRYPTDFYDGSRDIETPYGSTRIYEIGPEDGERILLVHGITTPSPVFAGVIPRLVEAGYRVCAYDLFGRGYSDSPNLSHDERLYNSQILCILQTIGWTKFHLVGYSLGGALAASFASYFPSSIGKLILIAPAGLLQQSDLSFARKIAINKHIPGFLIDGAVSKALTPKVMEVADKTAGDRVDVVKVLQWQVENHKGFRRSYLSTFRYGPIFDRWDLYQRLKSRNLDVHAIWGDRDDIVDTEIVSSNLLKALPDVKLSIVDGVAHDICTAIPTELVRRIVLILKA